MKKHLILVTIISGILSMSTNIFFKAVMIGKIIMKNINFLITIKYSNPLIKKVNKFYLTCYIEEYKSLEIIIPVYNKFNAFHYLVMVPRNQSQQTVTNKKTYIINTLRGHNVWAK